MTLVILFSGVFLMVMFVTLGATRQSKPQSQRKVGAEWLAEMSLDRYRPMLRLLDPADLKLLATQPGFKPSMARRLRRQRCDVFARYLANLSADFDRAMLFASAVAAQKPGSRSELRSLCARAGRRFARRRFVAERRLALYRRFGIGSVKAAELVELFAQAGRELHLAGIAARTQEFGFQISTSHFQRPSSCLQ
jgi:hypothetical protein